MRGAMASLAVLALAAIGCSLATPRPTPTPAVLDGTLADGFGASVAFAGLTRPAAVRFGDNGWAWVAEQAGVVKVFERAGDSQPAFTADLSDHVLGRNNRGLLGLAPDPTEPLAAYVLYTFPAPPGTDDVVWHDGADNCPDGTTRSCVSTGVLARVEFADDGTFSETRLVRGWCHQHASHVPDDLQVGPDGALYASSGEGSVPELDLDDGTWLAPDLRCNAGAFASRASPAEREAGEWDGAIVRFEAADLAAAAAGGQPADWLAQRGRVVAYGLRNPFRMIFRSDSHELWVGDPGWDTYEEIDVIPDAADDVVEDFGWPCREGHQPATNYARDARCAALTADPSLAIEPWFVEQHGEPVVAGDDCPAAASAIAAIAFGPAGWPAPYAGGLFFADYVRGCLYLAPADAGGTPDAAAVQPFWTGAGPATDITAGPDGALYVALIDQGVVARITRQ